MIILEMQLIDVRADKAQDVQLSFKNHDFNILWSCNHGAATKVTDELIEADRVRAENFLERQVRVGKRAKIST